MILEHPPAPRLSWPARLCLLAIGGIVLPASITAVGEDVPTNEKSDVKIAGSAVDRPSDLILQAQPVEKRDNNRATAKSSPGRAGTEVEKTVIRIIPLSHGDAREVLVKLKARLGSLPSQGVGGFAGLLPKLAADSRTNSIIVSGSERQLEAVNARVLALDQPKTDTPPKEPRRGETITVVRAQYVLPQKVTETFDKFIQQHGEHFEFLVCKVTRSTRAPYDDEEFGMIGRGLDRSTLGARGGMAGMGGGVAGGFGFGGRGLSQRADSMSQLTIIATPEIQQHFREFIKALQEPRDNTDQRANADAPETLTLVRARYTLPRTPTSKQQRMPRSGMSPSEMREIADAFDGLLGIPNRVDDPPSLGNGVFDLLTAVKESHLVPLLLVSADDDRLTVTTTEDFQQQLGNFIRFLQEHEPKDTGQRPSQTTLGVDQTGRDDELRQQEANALLAQARYKLKAGELENAREIALKAAKLSVTYDLFDDRPDLVLADIAKAEAADGDKSTRSTSRIERLIFGLEPLGNSRAARSRLSELRDQERELSALLSAIKASLAAGGNRMLLLLAMNQFYGDNAASTSLIEMFNTLVELETQKGELVQSHGVRHPSVMSVQQKIDTYRHSFGLPTGEDAKPLDLLDIYVQALKRQLDVTRKVIEALDESQKQSSLQPDDRKRLESQIRELETTVALQTELLQAVEDGVQAGGSLEGARRAIAYLDSDTYRKHLQNLAGDDLDLVDRSVRVAKEFYELIQQEQNLVRVRNLGPNHPNIRKVHREIANHLNSLGLTGYREVHPAYYLKFMIDQLRRMLETSRIQLDALKEQRAAYQKGRDIERNLGLRQPKSILDKNRDRQSEVRSN